MCMRVWVCVCVAWNRFWYNYLSNEDEVNSIINNRPQYGQMFRGRLNEMTHYPHIFSVPIFSTIFLLCDIFPFPHPLRSKVANLKITLLHYLSTEKCGIFEIFVSFLNWKKNCFRKKNFFFKFPSQENVISIFFQITIFLSIYNHFFMHLNKQIDKLSYHYTFSVIVRGKSIHKKIKVH